MKFTITRADLLRALGHVVPVADAKSTMPVLGNVHLEARGDKRLSLAASNLEITATAEATAAVEKAGAICLPARGLLDRAKALPDGEITVSLKDVTATLKAKASPRKFTLTGIPAEEFPTLPVLEQPGWSHEMPALELAGILDATATCVSDDQTRVHLSSLRVEQVGSGLRAVATDGHRLALAATHAGLPIKPDREMLVPGQAVRRIKALVESAEDVVRLACVQSNLWVTVGGDSICCKLTNATFPPYRQVIPEKSDVSATIDRAALLAATRAVSVAASTRSGGIKLDLSHNKIVLTAESPDDGEGVDEIVAECQVQAPRTYGINARYLIEALSAIHTDTVLARMSGELDPIVIEPVGATREQTLTLMPMRI